MECCHCCTHLDWLNYVPVVGYTHDSVFIADSLPELCDAVSPFYNRSISTDNFLKLWNTSVFKMPLYRNTFISVTNNQPIEDHLSIE